MTKKNGTETGNPFPGSIRRSRVWIPVAGGIGCCVLLMFLAHWLVAISVSFAVWVYVDATLMGITRARPSVVGSRHMPAFWGLLGLLPPVGLGIYLLLRTQLIVRGTEHDAARDPAVRSPSLASPGGGVLLVLVVAMVYLGLDVDAKAEPNSSDSRHSTVSAEAPAAVEALKASALRFGHRSDRSGRLEVSGEAYRVGSLVAELDLSGMPGHGEPLYWELHVIEARGLLVESGPLARARARRDIWSWKFFVPRAGRYRMVVISTDQTPLASGDLTVVDY